MTKAVPTTPTTFVGRQEELALLRESFARGAPLVTVLGPPGIGKSRLAMRFSEEALDEKRFARAIVCELGAASRLDDLCAILGRALEGRRGAGDRVAELSAHLAALDGALVVFDDLDRIAAVAASAIARWMRAAPSVRFLVTSRVGLRLVGETTLALGPLSLPASDAEVERSEAVQLFVARARQVRPSYGLGGEASEVAALVRELDGIPLAIELAASRMTVLSAAQLRSSLTRRFDILATPAGDAHRTTLLEAIEASWRLLEPYEAHALAQVAVFRGGFDLEAARHVVNLPAGSSLLEGLEGLVTKSLLFVRAPEMRFDLYASIREHALGKLEASGEGGAVAERHAAHFLKALAGAEPAWVERERDNLLAAHEALAAAGATSPRLVEGAIAIAMALEPVLMRWGPLQRWLDLLEEALAGATKISPSIRRSALVARARALHRVGRHTDSREAFEGALATARRARDAASAAAARAGLGELLRELGDLSGAEQHLVAALDHLAAAGDRAREIAAHTALGHVFLVSGRPGPARSHYDQALRRAAGHDRDAKAAAEIGLGIAALAARQLDDAGEHFERAARGGDLPLYLEELRLVHLSILRQEEHRFGEALASAERALSIAQKLGPTRAEGRARVQLGMVLFERDDLDRACEALALATSDLREAGDVRADVVFSAALAAAEARRGAKAEAARLLRWVEEQGVEARARAARQPDPLDAVVAVYRASVKGESPPPFEGDLENSSHHLRVALRIVRDREPLRGEPAPLVVARDGRWCRLPDGTEIRFTRGRSQRLMLLRLLDERLSAPGRAVSILSLFEHGWPDESTAGDSWHNRVHVSLSRLRKRGFSKVLVSRDDGLLLDPAVPVCRAEADPAVAAAKRKEM